MNYRKKKNISYDKNMEISLRTFFIHLVKNNNNVLIETFKTRIQKNKKYLYLISNISYYFQHFGKILFANG